jgi:hypothetical protein
MASPAPHTVERVARFQFTLRGMLGLMFVAGVAAAAWKVAPQMVVLALVVLTAVDSAWRIRGRIRRGERISLRQAGLFATTWCGLYGVSVGPAVGLLRWAPLNREPLEWFYAPLVWLHEHTWLAGVIEWYVGFWR